MRDGSCGLLLAAVAITTRPTANRMAVRAITCRTRDRRRRGRGRGQACDDTTRPEAGLTISWLYFRSIKSSNNANF